MSQIAIDLGGTNLRVARVGENGIEQIITEPCNALGSEQEVVEQIKNLVRLVLADDVERIGVAVPSVVDFEHGVVYNVMNIPSWVEVPLKRYLEQEFHLPTWVDNDVNCFVAGEKAFGAGKPYNNLIGITLGTGVGAGIIIDGKVYRGHNTGAGEVCCLPYLEGNYEEYTSSQLFKKWNTTGADDCRRADAGDAVALQHWHELGFHLGKLLQVLLYTYDPEAIIIGGGIARSHRHFETAMRQSLADGFQYPREVERVQVHFSTLKESNLLGASQL